MLLCFPTATLLKSAELVSHISLFFSFPVSLLQPVLSVTGEPNSINRIDSN